VFKKTCVAGGMLIAMATGAIITTLPAFAEVPTWGGGGCCSGSSHHFRDSSRSRSWNGTENEQFNHIRLRVHNRNNNVAVARTGQRGEDDGLGLGVGGPTGGA
jgi:hypothetical protein